MDPERETVRSGWSIQEAGELLNISPTKVSQAINPAFTKVAKLMLADPKKTMADLLTALVDEEIRQRIEADEINRRKLEADGRRWRATLYPKGVTTK